MQDILKEYKKNMVISNIWIIAASLIIALGINFIVIDWTDIWKTLQVNILNSNWIEVNSDIYLDKKGEDFEILSSKDITAIRTLTLSLAYNPENISIDNFTSWNAEIVNINNSPWINSVIINFMEPTNINIAWSVLKFNTYKKNNKSENINIMNANFSDFEWITYWLSTSWLTF